MIMMSVICVVYGFRIRNRTITVLKLSQELKIYLICFLLVVAANEESYR